MDEHRNFFQNYFLSDEESQINSNQAYLEDAKNNLFQLDFQEYLCPSPLFSQNLSLIDIEKVYEIQNLEENEAEQNTIIPNINNNQKIDMPFNEINKLQTISPTKTTTFLTKKKGRKSIKSNEKGIHTKYSPDNRREYYWRLFMNFILVLANSISYPDKMEPTNFIKQYGGNSIVDNEKFLKVKIYQYFSYNTVFNDDKNHRKTGNNNLKVIKKMVFEKKNETYIFIMKSTIEEMFEIFKKNEKYIIKNDKKYYIPGFKTIDDACIEIQNDLENDNVLSAEQIQVELNRVATLVDYIKIKGKEIKRKIKSTRIIDYIKIPELEDN